MHVYIYANCSTCRKALRFLRDRSLEPEIRSVIDSPPSRDELAQLHRASGLPLRRFFNTSGRRYRELNLSARMDALSDDERLDLLASDGMLLRRPLAVLDDGAVLVGFREDEWTRALSEAES